MSSAFNDCSVELKQVVEKVVLMRITWWYQYVHIIEKYETNNISFKVQSFFIVLRHRSIFVLECNARVRACVYVLRFSHYPIMEPNYIAASHCSKAVRSVLGGAEYKPSLIQSLNQTLAEQCLQQLKKKGKPFKFFGKWLQTQSRYISLGYICLEALNFGSATIQYHACLQWQQIYLVQWKKSSIHRAVLFGTQMSTVMDRHWRCISYVQFTNLSLFLMCLSRLLDVPMEECHPVLHCCGCWNRAMRK